MKIFVPKGTRFVGHPGKRHLTKKLCVASGETEPIWVVLSFSDLGLSNITGEGPALWAPPPGHPGAQALPTGMGEVRGGGSRFREGPLEEQESSWGGRSEGMVRNGGGGP